MEPPGRSIVRRNIAKSGFPQRPGGEWRGCRPLATSLRSLCRFRAPIRCPAASQERIEAAGKAAAELGMDYSRYFVEATDRLREERRYRVFAPLERSAARFPRALWRRTENGVTEKRDIVVWCPNDYLGMGRHPQVVAAMQEAAGRYGAGAGGTRNISGNSGPVVDLEAELADLHRKEAALV